MVVLPGDDDAVPDASSGEARRIAVAMTNKMGGMLGANALGTVAGRGVYWITFRQEQNAGDYKAL